MRTPSVNSASERKCISKLATGHPFGAGTFMVHSVKKPTHLNYLMNKDQPFQGSVEAISSEPQPWTEAWEQAWEAYQGQKKPGGDENLAAFRNRAMEENDARYLGVKYFEEVGQYLPKGQCPPA
jgi:hypothetical protein